MVNFFPWALRKETLEPVQQFPSFNTYLSQAYYVLSAMALNFPISPKPILRGIDYLKVLLEMRLSDFKFISRNKM